MMESRLNSYLFFPLLLSLTYLCLATTEADLCVKSCHDDEGGLLECTSRCERNLDSWANTEDPRRLYDLCRKRCERKGRDTPSQQECKRDCRKQYESQRGETTKQRSTRWIEEEEETDNPYYFSSRSFRTWFRSSNGHCRVLPKFTSRSRLFRGIENYRFAVLEAEPRTFISPHHTDADVILIVVEGNGTFTFVSQNSSESFNLECGHVAKVPAGTTHYVSNPNENERLRVAKLYRPVSTPGKFKEYFIAAGRNQQSYLRGFSREVLEAGYNTEWERLEKLFGQEHRRQSQEVIRQASSEQLRALSQHAKSAEKARRGSKLVAFDIRSDRPKYSNEYGQFFEANPNDSPQLRDVDASVAFANMSEGTVMATHFNSKATYLVFVLEGRARCEMSCPHISSRGRQRWETQEEEGESRPRRGWEGEEDSEEEEEEEEESFGKYEKIRADVSKGDVFLVPPDHPVALIATENFKAIGFGLNARDNQRNFIAGKENIINRMDAVAKELTFGVKADLVDEVFQRNPKKAFFVPSRGGGRQQGQGYHDHRSREKLSSFQSILNMVAEF